MAHNTNVIYYIIRGKTGYKVFSPYTVYTIVAQLYSVSKYYTKEQ